MLSSEKVRAVTWNRAPETCLCLNQSSKHQKPVITIQSTKNKLLQYVKQTTGNLFLFKRDHQVHTQSTRNMAIIWNTALGTCCHLNRALGTCCHLKQSTRNTLHLKQSTRYMLSFETEHQEHAAIWTEHQEQAAIWNRALGTGCHLKQSTRNRLPFKTEHQEQAAIWNRAPGTGCHLKQSTRNRLPFGTEHQEQAAIWNRAQFCQNNNNTKFSFWLHWSIKCNVGNLQFLFTF